MKRYYLSPIVGDGTRGNPYRAKIQDYGVTVAALIPTDANGVPTRPWCLCHVEAQNHIPLLADAALEALPDVSLDVKWTAVGTAVQRRLENAMAARGVTIVSDGQTGYREIIRQIGQALEPTFSENNFSV